MNYNIFLTAATDTIEKAVETANEINPNSIIPDGDMGKLMYGFQVTLMGMGMVFIILILLMIMIKLFKIFFGTENNKEPESKKIIPESVSPVIKSENEDEIAAVISAVIATYYSSKPEGESKYKIRSFKRVV
jgi:sodium pump decarboxylase gamma subunit